MVSTSRNLLALTAAGGLTALLVSPAVALLRYPWGPMDGAASEPPLYTNCTLCHNSGGPVNSKDGDLLISGLPGEYTPGATYTLVIQLSDPAQQRWGFEITALDRNGAPAGGFMISDAVNTQLSVDPSTGNQYVKHTTTGTFAGAPGGATWSVDWTAPAAGTGTVYFYASGNAANWDNNQTGDFIYNAAATIAEGGAAHPDMTLVLQPASAFVTAGDLVNLHATVRNHTQVRSSIWVVTQATGPGGTSTFPPGGSLTPPVKLDLDPQGQADVHFDLFLPATVPPGTWRMTGAIGLPPATVVDRYEFDLTVY